MYGGFAIGGAEYGGIIRRVAPIFPALGLPATILSTARPNVSVVEIFTEEVDILDSLRSPRSVVGTKTEEIYLVITPSSEKVVL